MAKSSIIQQYARIGAAARIKEVQDEIAAIGHMFHRRVGPARKQRRKAGTQAPATGTIDSTLEKAQQIACHESPRTTKLYDRSNYTLTLDEIERIML